MTHALLLAGLLLTLAGCASFGYYGREPYVSTPYGATPYGIPEVVTRPPDLYTRSDIDAINAEATCRALARNTLQASRCGIRR